MVVPGVWEVRGMPDQVLMGESEKAWLSCTKEISITCEVSQLGRLVFCCCRELNLKFFFSRFFFSSTITYGYEEVEMKSSHVL